MKIYINIPAGAVAGGVESLFQLASFINDIGGDSIVLFDKNISNPIPPKYSHYNIKYSNEIENTPENLIIYPEVWTEKLFTYSNMKQAIWWLSVDNNQGKFKDFNNPNITHFYQSHYALFYLSNNKAYRHLPLFDYISSQYASRDFSTGEKQNIVCYNPAKGKHITDQLIKTNPDIKFTPLINMSEEQMINTLLQSKVYIDFGHHPGKDRIPREAASLGNCVITGFKGASMFYNDTPIDIKYKFNDISNVGNVIRDCFNDFETNLNNFSLYRSIIKNQKEELFNQCKQYFLL